MTLRSDAHDLGQLLSFALRPKARPGADGTYTTLVSRYLNDANFRDAFDGLTDGLDLRVLHAGDLGVILSARRESVFAYRLSGEPVTWSKDRARVLRGLAHLGIAAYAYPHPDDLHDPSVRYVDALPCEDFIRRACAQLRARADEVARGGDTGDQSQDRIVDLALAAGLDTAWSEWDQMPAADVGTRGRGSGRISSKSAVYWVLRACRELVDHGLARPVGKDTDGRFQLLERYRHQVGAYAAIEGYEALAALARVDEALPDRHDPDGAQPLPGRPPQWADQGTDPGTAADETAGGTPDDTADDPRNDTTEEVSA